MSSKYKDMFDSLKSDENTKRERAGKILSMQDADNGEITVQTGGGSAAKLCRNFFAGKRGIAILTAIFVFIAAAISIPTIIGLNGGGLLKAMSMLKDTYVDMDGVAAFGVWNAPDSSSETARISNVSYVNAAYASDKNVQTALATLSKNDGTAIEDWSDDERYDWESDYDWDPTKSNVLISIGSDGNVSEVVYERTNGRGQVRQDILGNAAMVYVSNGFTFVMYVDDAEWQIWTDYNFAQEMRGSSGFHCHHERMQTVVIHNETGKVFALKDVIPQVNELSGATNHTMQVHPFKDDFIYVRPMYGNYIPQWYNVIYDEQLEKIRYELILPPDSDAVKSYSLGYNVRAVRRDKYGQQYLLEGCGYEGIQYEPPRVSAGIVNIPPLKRYGNAVTLSVTNGVMLGNDGRMYAFDKNQLKVFGKNFELSPVEPDTEVNFEGIADDFEGRYGSVNDGIIYSLKDGYLYSMFGEIWKVTEGGYLQEYGDIQGSFPRFSDDAYLLGGEIIAFVNTTLTPDGRESKNGEIVRITFDNLNGEPNATFAHIIDASVISVRNKRMVIIQNELPWTYEFGFSKYFLITVRDGKPNAEHFANGYNGGITNLIKPITEPLDLTD